MRLFQRCGREQEGDPEAAARALPLGHQLMSPQVTEAPALLFCDHFVRLQVWPSAMENELSLGLLLEPLPSEEFCTSGPRRIHLAAGEVWAPGTRLSLQSTD